MRTASPRASRLDPWLGALAALLPFAVAVFRAAGGPQWRADLPALRDQGLVAVGFGGAVSTAATQLFSMLPLGNHSFRAALATAAALALACHAVWRLAHRVLREHPIAPRVVSVLACIAAITAGLSGTWQAESTVAGGAMFAVAPALMGIDVAVSLVIGGGASLTPSATRRWLLFAALLGLTVAQNAPCGFALTCAVVATMATAGKAPPRRLVPVLLAVTTLVCLVLCAPMLLRPLSPGSWSDVGRALSDASLEPLDVTATRKAALLTWLREVGIVALSLAALGLVVGVFREKRRAPMAALVALAIVDLIYPLGATTQLVADPLAALRALALAAFSIAAALGVAELVLFLGNLRVPMARTASVLVVVFHITIVAVTSDEAAFVADRSAHVATRAWTDEALGALPHRAAVLVHSPELAWRLWAAQTLSGERPDVLVIPVPLLRRGVTIASLLPSEPALEQVLRDVALTGSASEFGLSTLADARPLMVELDPQWDARMVSHLTVEGAWLRFTPQVLGGSDRKLAAVHTLDVKGPVASRLDAGHAPDASSNSVVARTLKEHIAALSLVGMSASTDGMLDGLERLEPRDPFVVSARLRLAHAGRTKRTHRSVELRDLLVF